MTNDVKDGHEEEIGRGEGAITRVCAPCRPLDYNVMRMAVPAICPDVMDAVTQRHFSAGERLSINDQESHQITIVATGAVREQVILNDGRRKIMGFLLSGDGLDDAREIAGLTFVAAKSGIYYELTETALQRCRRNGMSVEDWKNLQRDRRLAAYGKHILLLGRYTAVERVAAFLDDLILRIGRDCADGVDLLLPMGREDIADFLGLKSETVSRQLAQLKSSGILELLKPGHLMIKNRNRLSALIPVVETSKSDELHY
ncbi:MAG: helix-turn-helix domain-containing protein [Alphaproteobacteria bacterium]|jgi:CRP/FNR family transcriptional regulator, anaerobic regulatory protein|nr:helix-turn-helix domain-containing protein [Alphaproteobacteria bacterium]